MWRPREELMVLHRILLPFIILEGVSELKKER